MSSEPGVSRRLQKGQASRHAFSNRYGVLLPGRQQGGGLCRAMDDAFISRMYAERKDGLPDAFTPAHLSTVRRGVGSIRPEHVVLKIKRYGIIQ